MSIVKKIGALTSKPYAFNARPWELKNVNSIDILDSFGSSIRLDYRDKEILRVLPRDSEWITDKVRFFYDGLKYKRFHYSYLRKKGMLVKVSFLQILFFFKVFFRYFLDESQFAFGIGTLTDLESVFSTKMIASTLLSRGVNVSISQHNTTSFSANFKNYYLNINELKKADLLVLVDINLRLENPILNAIIRKQTLIDSNLKIFGIGNIITYNYYVKQLGVTTAILYDIIKGKHKFNLLIQQAKTPVFLFGSNFFKRVDGIAFFDLINRLNVIKNTIKVFHVPTSVSNLNCYEIGVDSFSNNRVRKEQDLHVNYLLGNSILLNSRKNALLICQSSNFTESVVDADLVLPEATFIEKETLYFTFNNALKRTKKIYNPPKQAFEGWDFLQLILCLLEMWAVKDEFLFIQNFKSLNFLKFKDLLGTRILKRSIFSQNFNLNVLSEPFLKNQLKDSCLLNTANLFYSTDELTKSSLFLNIRLGIEKENYKNFETKNGVF